MILPVGWYMSLHSNECIFVLFAVGMSLALMFQHWADDV